MIRFPAEITNVTIALENDQFDRSIPFENVLAAKYKPFTSLCHRPNTLLNQSANGFPPF